MDTTPARALLFLVPVFALLIVVGLIVLVVVLVSRSRKRPPPPATGSFPVASTPRRDRKAILQELADGQLTREEAEEALNDTGTPIPEAMPAPPHTGGSGASKGCLVAALIAIGLATLLLLGLGTLIHVRKCQVDVRREEVRRPLQEHGERLRHDVEKVERRNSASSESE
jgi:hypothetical protein